MIKYSINDINEETAKRAYMWCSFDPEKAGERERAAYVQKIKNIIDIAEKMSISSEQKEKAKEFLERYKSMLLEKWNSYLVAKSRTASPMITGASKFPTEKNRKALESEHKRSVELSDFIKKSEENLIKLIKNLMPAEAKSAEVQKRIVENINETVEILKNPGFYNTALFRSSLRGKMLTIAKHDPDLINFIVEKIKESPVKIFTDKNSFWGDLESLKKKQEEPIKINEETKINGIVINKNYEMDRVQLFFDGKPDQETISLLKHRGFHWSPSTKSWMRKLTFDAVKVAEIIAGGLK